MDREVQWDLLGKREFERKAKWYDRVPESELENKYTNPCGTSVCEQIMEMRRGDCIW